MKTSSASALEKKHGGQLRTRPNMGMWPERSWGGGRWTGQQRRLYTTAVLYLPGDTGSVAEFSSSADGFVVLPPHAVTPIRSKQAHKSLDQPARVRGVGGGSDPWYSHAGYPLFVVCAPLF